MAEVTSGKNLTVMVLDESEAQALARLLGTNYMKGTLEDDLASLRDALVEAPEWVRA